ncbi:hypothetical protein Cs7R123_37220 [Catellatospora sp. TT07R-123]|uniref:ATP-binding protein n=1 Tax=Catellatospora sp. TT07R-123 TaxID=2733863 RepID=UPI001B238FFA|nr:ATP-binding protein [Catellatospora sp. TT07R-123]GHJ46380.1 hypothetical protein Cs7R123_37220 [Catellatospora sp. TT07R-123]
MSVRLPSRYEDLDVAFRARLRPNPDLIQVVQRCYSSMKISGGLRFLPLYGRSGSGKSSAVRELATHLPECRVVELTRSQIQSEVELVAAVTSHPGRGQLTPQITVAVVDQYEEVVAEQNAVPSQFVERLSLLDRGVLKDSCVLVVWLTTSREFQAQLAGATTRNERILASAGMELVGPAKSEWPAIIEETFEFHNGGQNLPDQEVLRTDLEEIAATTGTIGSAIERVGGQLGERMGALQDLSKHQVVMLWPVTDGLRIQRIQSFTNAREGYRLNWGSFYQELSADDRRTLPLAAYNRARLYFDVRLVPIAAADIYPLCRDLSDSAPSIGKSYLDRFEQSHFVSLLKETWNLDSFTPMKERESKRAAVARDWYNTSGVTRDPVGLGRRLAYCLGEIGISAKHEQDIVTPHSTVRADILVSRGNSFQSEVIVEMKAFSAENTMPSSIRDAIKTTLRRHAQLAGFLPRT